MTGGVGFTVGVVVVGVFGIGVVDTGVFVVFIVEGVFCEVVEVSSVVIAVFDDCLPQKIVTNKTPHTIMMPKVIPIFCCKLFCSIFLLN